MTQVAKLNNVISGESLYPLGTTPGRIQQRQTVVPRGHRRGCLLMGQGHFQG